MDKRGLKRAAIRLWGQAQPAFQVQAGGRSLRVPASSPETRNVVDWTPDWKTQLIDATTRERPGVLIDIGANIGQTLMDYCAAARPGGYIGFEPNPKCIDQLNTIIEANDLPDCAIVGAGLSSETGLVELYLGEHAGADEAATIVRGQQPLVTMKTRLIPVFAFDAVIAELLKSRPISLIKIDVEGAELEVLQGMARTLFELRPWITCEVLHRDAHADADQHAARHRAVFALVEGAGYVVFRLFKRDGKAAISHFKRVDAFPVEVYSARNAQECDYLFVPEDEAAAIERLGFPVEAVT